MGPVGREDEGGGGGRYSEEIIGHISYKGVWKCWKQ